MIAKVVRPKKAKSSLKNLYSYLVQSNTARVGTSFFMNTVSGGNDLLSLKEIQWLKEQAGTDSDKLYHFIVSLREGETLDQKAVHDVARTHMKALGFDGHQSIVVTHTDTANFHIHVVVNKIHPETRNIITPYRDYIVLDKTCMALEKKYALKPDNRTHAVAASRSVTPEEQEAFERRLKEGRAPLLTLIPSAKSWEELHQKLAEMNLEIALRGNGVVFKDTKTQAAVKASFLDRSFSKSQLQKRLGLFVENANLNKTISASSKDYEARTGLQSFQSWIKDRASQLINRLKNENSWDGIHQVLSDYKLSIQIRGNGLVVGSSEQSVFIKASAIDRSLSKTRLEKRLGPFEVSSSKRVSGAQRDHYQTGSTGTTNTSLYNEYLSVIDFRKQERMRLSDERKRLDAWYGDCVRSIHKDFMLGWRLKKHLLYKINGLYFERCGEIAMAAKIMPYQTWKAFLKQEALKGRSDAVQLLRKKAKNQHQQSPKNYVYGKHSSTHLVPGFAKVNGAGDLVYKFGQTEVRDENGVMVFYGKCSKKDLKRCLTIILQKYQKGVTIKGSDEFKKQLQELLLQTEKGKTEVSQEIATAKSEKMGIFLYRNNKPKLDLRDSVTR